MFSKSKIEKKNFKCGFNIRDQDPDPDPLLNFGRIRIREKKMADPKHWGEYYNGNTNLGDVAKYPKY